jgi:hypothetical protein
MTSTAPGRRLVFFVVGLFALALLSAACGGSGAESTATPTPTASVAPGTSDLEQQLAESGLADLAAAIAVVLRGESEALEDQIEFSNRPCSAALDPGSEPGCAYEVASSPSGNVRRYLESEGTNVEVFPFAACNLEWRRADELIDVFDWVEGADPQVYAVFEAPEERQLPGDYVTVFSSEDRQFGLAVYTRGDKVTAIAQGCSPNPSSLIPVDQESFIVAPPRAESPVTEAVAGNARIITDNLNVRLGPGLDYSTVGQLNDGAQIDILGRSVDGEWLAVDGAGWIFYNPEWIDLGVTLPSLAALHVSTTMGTIGELHPEGTHLGVVAVDEVIDAVAGGDAAAINALISYIQVPCTNGRPGPSCGNLTPGTPADAVYFEACEGEYHRRGSSTLGQSVLTRSEGATATDRLRLYLVVETPDETNAQYAALFAFDSAPHSGRLVLIGNDGGIVGASVGCGEEAPVWMLRAIEGAAVAVLLPPRPEALDPSPQ